LGALPGELEDKKNPADEKKPIMYVGAILEKKTSSI
jgi:hypothetical protein